MNIHFYLELVPRSIQYTGKRIATGKAGGPAARVFHSKEARKYLQDLALLSRVHKPRQPLEGAVSLEIAFIFPYPKGKPEGEFYRTARPDIDNLVKPIMDALCKAGFWRDDSQVVNLRTRKHHGEKPGLMISVSTT